MSLAFVRHAVATMDNVHHGIRANQHLPCRKSPAPLPHLLICLTSSFAALNDVLQPILELYFHLGMSDKEITTSVMDHFDSARYDISVYTVRRRRKDWGLESTHQQMYTVQSIATFVNDIKKRFPNRGAETIRKALLFENKIHVPRPIIAEYLRQTKPDAVDAQWYKRFKRWTFIAIGPNEMWSLHQHDKFKHYGLFFHVSLDPFPGVIHWCKVWWTVRNLKLIACFYFDTAWSIGGIPLITQSDPGTENVNVVYAQTALRHQMEPSLDGDWSVGFQQLLDEGVESGYYDIGDPLECLVFHFVFIPFIQQEVDAWVHQCNWTKHRSDQKKVLPNGTLMIILQKLHKWKATDYKVSISPEVFDEMEEKYAPPDDPVFKLVPHAFAVHANAVWMAMGSPQLQFNNAWEIYLHIRDAL
ncbi:hypothetical protein EDB86DRAFT_3085880 [Lactarius hatsudake]|nr:hypothetical protein EDB86DRAFT_3085880 [Lactarius hatsudake]